MSSTRSLSARVIATGDYSPFRGGLRRVVRHYLLQAAVSGAGSLNEVLCLAPSVSLEPPALFALDLLPPGFAVSQSIGHLRRAYRHSVIVIVLMLDNLRLVDEVLAAGVDGYLGKPLRAGEIGTALQIFGSGEPVVRLRGGSSADSRQRALLDTLTPRQ